jgi:hypothetical protein
MDGMSLLDVLRGVMLDPGEQAAYNADPRAYLEQYGYDDVDPADLSEAFGLVADTLPPDQAQAAWSAAAEPDDSTFGTVTQDFDGDAGLDPPDVGGGDGGTTTHDADPADRDVDIDGDGADDSGAPEVDDLDGVGSALSFGEGDGGDIDDPTFGEAADALTGAAGLDAGDESVGTTGDDADDDAFDAGYDEGGFDGGFDDDLADGLDAGGDDTGDDGFDDGVDDSLDEPDDAGADDLDIGSF